MGRRREGEGGVGEGCVESCRWLEKTVEAERRLQKAEEKLPLTSTVFPLALSSSLVSMIKARNHESRFFSLASRSYFSIVRLSTWSVCHTPEPQASGGVSYKEG